jgi:hypothetical protein
MNRTVAVSVTVAISVTVLALAAVICFAIYVHGNRYSTVNAGNGRVYRVDRRTGETVLIFGKQEMPVGRDPAERDLSAAELSKLTGQGGLSYADRFSGDVYNGNDGITVKELRVTVTTTVAGQAVSRSYRNDDMSIPPKTKGSFGFSIILGDNGASYQWHIEGARGCPES